LTQPASAADAHEAAAADRFRPRIGRRADAAPRRGPQAPSRARGGACAEAWRHGAARAAAAADAAERATLSRELAELSRLAGRRRHRCWPTSSRPVPARAPVLQHRHHLVDQLGELCPS
jgi:hypothetical protein